MRKVVYGGATSLDNFLARPDGAVDWIRWGEELAAFMKDSWPRYDTMVMGRKTYDVARGQGGGGGAYPGVTTFVFSRTLPAGTSNGVTVVGEDAAAFVAKLRKQKGKDICVMGGGELARSLFEADLIDEVGFNVHPVLLGAGIPAFHAMSRQIDLERIECRPFENGCVLVIYRVKRRNGG